jgi:hypothetical protein
MTSPSDQDVEALLRGWWMENVDGDEPGAVATPETLEAIAPCGRDWPGMAPASATRADPDRLADRYAKSFRKAYRRVRLGLVAADRGADALTVLGWSGPFNHTEDTAEISAVVRTWEDRFGARMVGIGLETLYLSVAAPPADQEQALRVAAEHFAFCPGNVWQGPDPCTLADYAGRLIGRTDWSFWWD